MATLVLLNGAPGVGKSTVATLLERDLGLVVVDPDGLRDRWPDAGAARAQAFSVIAATLAGGHDVVVPQLVARPAQLAGGFELVARAAGAGFRHVLLLHDGDDPVGRSVRGAAAATGPARADLDDDRVRSYLAGLDEVRAGRPDALVVASTEGDPDATAAAVTRALADGVAGGA